MTTYTEKNSRTLLTGSSDADGDTLTIRRINGTQISSWPLSVSLTLGSVSVSQAGVVTYDDGGNTNGHPLGGQTVTTGTFTFTLWDGAEESSTYTATVRLKGLNTAPTGQDLSLIFSV